MCLFNCKSRTVFSPNFYSLAGDRPKQGNSTPAATIPDTPTQDNPTQANERTESQSNPHGESDNKSADEEKSGNGARVSGHKVQGKYSIKFKIIDQTGKICNGMYYSVKVIGTKELYNSGTTDANGETEVFYSDIADKAYLYIGHRIEKFEDLPTSRSTPEQISDECNLNNGGDQQITMTPHEENKPPITVQTQRLWKPWTNSKNLKNWIIKNEGAFKNAYDHDSKSTRNVTIGVGKLLHNGPFVTTQSNVDSIISYLKIHHTPVTVTNIVNNIKNAIPSLSDNTANLMRSELQYINGMSESEVLSLFDKTFDEHVKFIPKDVHVPLFQGEYDALCDLAFNRGPYTIYNNNDFKDKKVDRRYGTYINAGRYYYTGKNLILNNASERVPNRRAEETNVWSNGINRAYNNVIKDYRGEDRPPWKHVILDE